MCRTAWRSLLLATSETKGSAKAGAPCLPCAGPSPCPEARNHMHTVLFSWARDHITVPPGGPKEFARIFPTIDTFY